MALSTCEDCGKDVSTLATACPHCGRPTHEPKTDNRNTILDDLKQGKRVSCPDGRCTGNLNSVGVCRSCGKNYDWEDGNGTLSRIADKLIEWGDNSPHGVINPSIICPHCRTKSCVRTKSVTQKKGVSGAKATGAIFTGGLSLLITGLSRKENLTQARCSNCGSNWTF